MSQRNDTATHPTGLSADEAAFQKRLQEQFLDAQPGTVIEIPAGRRALDRVLTLRANGVTIRGAAAYIDSTYRHYTGATASTCPANQPLYRCGRRPAGSTTCGVGSPPVMLISRCSTPTSEASAATPTHRLRKSACRSRPFRTGEATNRTMHGLPGRATGSCR